MLYNVSYTILKKLLIVCSIVLLFTNVWAQTPQEFIELLEDNIIRACEGSFQKETAELYECTLTEFYALRRVMGFLLTIDRESEDWGVLIHLLGKYELGEYKTFDFVSIHLAFEKYLKEK